MFNENNNNNQMNDDNKCMNDIWMEMISDVLTNVYSTLMVNEQDSFSSSCIIKDANEEVEYNETMLLQELYEKIELICNMTD